MFDRILVPLDGSSLAEHILIQIARILRREDSEILLLRVLDIPENFGRLSLESLRIAEREAAQKYLDELTRRLGLKGAKVHGRIAEGPAAETILEVARTEGCTMIAMATHGRTGLARWTMGSVAEKVARGSDIPLLLVRSFRRTRNNGLEPATAEELPFRSILVPVDGSPTSMSIIPAAEKFAQLYDSEVLVLHVGAPFIPAYPILPGMEAGLPPLEPPPRPAEADEVTRKAAERFRHAGLTARQLFVSGEPAAEIVDLSVTEGADLIALGTHGRTGLSRWALGSVAERVLRSAEVPLLLVRTPAVGRLEERVLAERMHLRRLAAGAE
jgi:nucleotide-binding universal stress UspA family protein